MEIETIPVKSIVEFVRFVHENCKDREVLFRGQHEDKDWPLRPKLARIIEHANPSIQIEEIEEKIFEEFKRRALPFIKDLDFKTELELLMHGQHYGLTTRLLDWSGNPLVALWFALQGSTVKHEENDNNNDKGNAVVWVFSPTPELNAEESWWNQPFRVPATMFVRPKHLDKRLIVQQGYFTIHKYDETRREFVPMEEDDGCSLYLTKLIIEPSSAESMKGDLERFGITKASLFPDLTGLCEHIRNLVELKLL